MIPRWGPPVARTVRHRTMGARPLVALCQGGPALRRRSQPRTQEDQEAVRPELKKALLGFFTCPILLPSHTTGHPEGSPSTQNLQLGFQILDSASKEFNPSSRWSQHEAGLRGPPLLLEELGACGNLVLSTRSHLRRFTSKVQQVRGAHPISSSTGLPVPASHREKISSGFAPRATCVFV